MPGRPTVGPAGKPTGTPWKKRKINKNDKQEGIKTQIDNHNIYSEKIYIAYSKYIYIMPRGERQSRRGYNTSISNLDTYRRIYQYQALPQNR